MNIFCVYFIYVQQLNNSLRISLVNFSKELTFLPVSKADTNKFTFLPVSKADTNKFNIFRQYSYIV
jgi:preprotein translocase subunit Sec63